MEYALNPDSQKLQDIFEQTRGSRHWARIYCKDGDVFEGYADCWTYETVGDDEDADAMLFVLRNGSLRQIAGAHIERFEVLESR